MFGTIFNASDVKWLFLVKEEQIILGDMKTQKGHFKILPEFPSNDNISKFVRYKRTKFVKDYQLVSYPAV